MKPKRKLPEAKPLFIERMKSLLPDKKDFDAYLKILKQEPVRSIRCNTLKISPKELKKKLETKGWKIQQPWKNHPEVMIVEGKIAKSKDFHNKKIINTKIPDKSDNSINKSSLIPCKEKQLVKLGPGELGRALEHLLGYYYIQELASMLPVIALNPKPGETILDLCSAPGSKTTQLASYMNNTGTIIANEVSLGRIKILASNLERCGVTNTIITKKDGSALCKRLKQQAIQFDKILVDAPCSGEGTLRSSPKTYIMWNPKAIKAVCKIQKSLLANAIKILKPNREIIYSTCTHAPEENEGVIDFILKNFNNIKIEKIKLPIKTREGISSFDNESYHQSVKLAHRIYPHDANTEGFFIVKIREVK